MNENEIQSFLAEQETKRRGEGMVLGTSAGFFESGQVFEAKTKKNHWNYLVFMFVRDGNVYYCHGDKAKKVSREQFLKAIDYGDVRPVPKEMQDPERLSLSVLGMMAMSNGMSFNDYLKVMYGHGDGSDPMNSARSAQD